MIITYLAGAITLIATYIKHRETLDDNVIFWVNKVFFPGFAGFAGLATINAVELMESLNYVTQSFALILSTAASAIGLINAVYKFIENRNAHKKTKEEVKEENKEDNSPIDY